MNTVRDVPMPKGDPIPEFDADLMEIQKALTDLALKCARADHMELSSLLLAHSQSLGFIGQIIKDSTS